MALNLLEQVPVQPRLSTAAIHAQSEACMNRKGVGNHIAKQTRTASLKVLELSKMTSFL